MLLTIRMSSNVDAKTIIVVTGEKIVDVVNGNYMTVDLRV